MREILFRGKRVDNGEWVEGYYFKMSETTYAFAESYERRPVPTHHYIVSERMTDWSLPNRPYFEEADPETVCQFTGLTDKNGRKIWENDIIRYNKKLFRVAWKSECTHFAAYPMDEEIRYAPCLNIGTMKAVEVVGNIFDNPSLIE